tara:strand:+ start:779 stop:955 length:177 start_codon:yes stop_codon:yes gene_type:complete
MKIQLINKDSNLPNCWKECGVSFEDWEKLKSGKEISVKNISDSIKNFVKFKENKKESK